MHALLPSSWIRASVTQPNYHDIALPFSGVRRFIFRKVIIHVS